VPNEAPGKHLTQEEWGRIEATKAKREFFAAKDRLLRHPDRKLRDAERTPARFRETPNLWRDLVTFIPTGGPNAEHRVTPTLTIRTTVHPSD
jgi:hypothetical protein